MSKEHSLRLEQLDVGYGSRVLLQKVSLEVQPGQILTLIGPNGAGKTTLLRTLTGQIRELGGKVLVGEEEFLSLSGMERARQMSMMMTGRPGTEWMSCREVVSTGRYPYTGRFGRLSQKDKEIVEECIRLVSAEDVADQDFGRISDGQKQRVMLARALCQEPRVLVLDEPTSYLDVRFKLEILDIIRRLAGEKHIAVIMSLHELDLARKVSDRIACVKQGKVQKVGTPEEIFNDQYIAELYDIKEGSFDPLYGLSQLASVKGSPSVFVIGGGGSAIDTYYRLQRERIPFAAGILMENDVETPIARALAAEVFVTPAFCSPDGELMKRAKACRDGCEQVICTLDAFGPYNKYNEELKNG